MCTLGFLSRRSHINANFLLLFEFSVLALGLTSPLYNRYRAIPGGKAAGT
jgi:hypothetical protein